MTEPNGCAHCDIALREHFRRWTPQCGWHAWVQPSTAQILARMQARRAARLNSQNGGTR
ncbi:hypothetical protein ACIQOW_03540 [Kitasatospora sp. NPDC091335]|uniref:hypothetical protein n=1 Tax=Kitasatospora sp. NPDC091335 TaxID=3364085 RepID=UPI00382E9BFC